MRPGTFRVGDWLAQPSLDRVERNGRVVHLRPKTMQVLTELAARAGEVVPREDLQRLVWRDVHVSEESLSHCIAEIRSVFEDDPHQPTYVETVAKHGYRLIAPVVRDSQADQSAASGGVTGNAGRRFAWTPRRAALIALVAVIGIAAAVAVVRRWKPTPAGDGVHSVVVADWENRTGDPVLDSTLRQALSIALDGSGSIRVVSRERVAHALRLMRFAPDTRVTDEVARQVCRRIGAGLVAAGEVAKLGDQFVVFVELTGCTSATPLARFRQAAARKDDVLAALDRAAADVRRRLGAVPAGTSDAARPLEDVTTSNLEALRAFTLAQEALAERRTAEAIALFDHAIQLDPGFALAHSRLGSTLAALREWKHANEHRRRAVELAGELTERERLYVNAAFRLGLGRSAEAEDLLKTWARLYPGDRVPLGWLAVSHLNRGELTEALSWGQAAAKVDPSPATLVNLAAAYLNSGRVDDARSAAEGLNEPGLQYLIAFLDGDEAGMERLAARVQPGSAAELDMRARQAQVAMTTGRLHEGRQLVGRAETLGLSLGLLELTAQVVASHAVWEAEVGDARLALELAAAALSLAENSSTRALAVLAFARSGDLTRARSLEARIGASPIEIDPAIAAGCRRKLAAAIDLASGRPEVALRRLEGLHPYEDGGVVNHVALRGDIAELGVYHLRGAALLALGKGTEAAAQFQRVINRRGVSPISPYYTLATLNLARAHALAGDLDAARQGYADFLERWRRADPDGTLLVDVKREASRLMASPPRQTR